MNDDCPDANDLGAFVARALPDEARRTIEAHLDTCASCLNDVREIVRADLPDAPPASIDWSDASAPHTDTTEPLRRGSVVGRYSIVEMLGKGGMGAVYLARDARLERQVALKILHDHGASAEAESRWIREARLMGRLAHPHIVTVFDAGIADGHRYIAMERLSGPTLAAWLAASPRAPGEILERFLLAGQALAHAHAARIVHRDFKPANVLLDGVKRIAVTDFGIAATLGTMIPAGSGQGVPEGTPAPLVGETRLTSTGQVLGTPRYMSPEQFLGEPATAASDQFSFAVALHEALFRQLPFGGGSLDERRERILAHDLSTPSAALLKEVPAAVPAALVRAMSRRPEDRHRDMDALLAALSPHVRPRTGRRGIGIGLAATGVLAVAAAFASHRSVSSAARGEATSCSALPASALACGCADLPLQPVAPTAYFVLDNSSSMRDEGKWPVVRRAVDTIDRDAVSSFRVGATIFPGARRFTAACAAGDEVLAPQRREDRSSPALIDALDVPPGGASPLYGTLRELRVKVSRMVADAPAVVIVITDGDLNCKEVSSCDASDCLTNLHRERHCTPEGPSCCVAENGTTAYCLDEHGAAAATSALAAVGIPVIVAATQPSPRYVPVLDAIARAGGHPFSGAHAYLELTDDTIPQLEAAVRAVLRGSGSASACTARLDGALATAPQLEVGAAGRRLETTEWSREGALLHLRPETCALAGSSIVVSRPCASP